MTLDQIIAKLQEARASFPCDTDDVTVNGHTIDEVHYDHTDSNINLKSYSIKDDIDAAEEDQRSAENELHTAESIIDDLRDHLHDIKRMANELNEDDQQDQGIDTDLLNLINEEI